jgi:hypothetical protein
MKENYDGNIGNEEKEYEDLDGQGVAAAMELE